MGESYNLNIYIHIYESIRHYTNKKGKHAQKINTLLYQYMFIG